MARVYGIRHTVPKLDLLTDGTAKHLLFEGLHILVPNATFLLIAYELRSSFLNR